LKDCSLILVVALITTVTPMSHLSSIGVSS
jgi:hypothetical protein